MTIGGLLFASHSFNIVATHSLWRLIDLVATGVLGLNNSIQLSSLRRLLNLSLISVHLPRPNSSFRLFPSQSKHWKGGEARDLKKDSMTRGQQGCVIFEWDWLGERHRRQHFIKHIDAQVKSHSISSSIPILSVFIPAPRISSTSANLYFVRSQRYTALSHSKPK